MPIYNYECSKCQEQILNSWTPSWKDPAPACPVCNTAMTKIFLPDGNCLLKGLSTPGSSSLSSYCHRYPKNACHARKLGGGSNVTAEQIEKLKQHMIEREQSKLPASGLTPLEGNNVNTTERTTPSNI